MKYVCTTKSTKYETSKIIRCTNADVYYSVSDGYTNGPRISNLCPYSFFYQNCGLDLLENQKNIFLAMTVSNELEKEVTRTAKTICGVLCRQPLYGYLNLRDSFDFCLYRKTNKLCFQDQTIQKDVRICRSLVERKQCDGFCDKGSFTYDVIKFWAFFTPLPPSRHHSSSFENPP